MLLILQYVKINVQHIYINKNINKQYNINVINGDRNTRYFRDSDIIRYVIATFVANHIIFFSINMLCESRMNRLCTGCCKTIWCSDCWS